jgi:putative DNA primase/helicase
MTDFHQFASAHGLIIKNLDQGRWVRTPTTDKPRSRNGAFFYGGDYGFVQNWAEMTEVAVWQIDKPMAATDRAEMQARMDASRKAYARERGIKQAIAAKKARFILGLTELDRHAYLDSHGMPDDVGNVWKREGFDPLLVIPMMIGKAVVGCQLISISGEKRFITGQRCNNAEFVIGNGGMDIWCEGFATGMAIRKAVEALKVMARIHVTFSAGNMLKMAKTGIVVADHDVSQVGQQTAVATGLPFYLPEREGDDFCDEWMRIRTLAASMKLRKLLQRVGKSV